MEKEDCSRPPPPPPGDAPWLVYTHSDGETQQLQTFCTMSPLPPNNSFFIKSIPELRNKSIVNCCHGWLILCDLEYTNMFSLFNPVTLEVLHLPPLLYPFPDDEGFLSCTLTQPPNLDFIANDHTKACVFLLFFTGLAFSCRPSSSSSPVWVTHTLELGGETAFLSRPLTVNGVVYGRGGAVSEDSTYLVSIEDYDSISFNLESLLVALPLWSILATRNCWFLVESCGQIYCVTIHLRHDFEYNRASAVSVFELNLHEREWVEIQSLNGRAFFLGPECCTWCWGIRSDPTPLGGCVESDCIYFFMPTQGVETLYSYRLCDRTFTALCPCRELVRPYNFPIWVTPQHQGSLARQGWNKTANESCVAYQDQVVPFEQNELSVQNATHASLLDVIPLHVIELSLKHMHLFDYRNFQASCKTFHAAFPSAIEWRTNNLLPFFISIKNDDGLCQIIDLFKVDSRSSIIHLSPSPFIIEFCKDGWLIILNNKLFLEFFNPFTRKRMDLPSGIGNMHRTFSSIGFSTRPDCPECLTVGIFDLCESTIIAYIEARHKAWKHLMIDDGLYEFHSGDSSPVYYDGAFYFLGRNGYVGVFELIDGQPSWKTYHKPPDVLVGTFQENHIVECGGVLYSVFIGDTGKWVKVYKFDKLETKWIKVDCLGNHCLFVGRNSTFSMVAEEDKMKNKIYLSRPKRNAIVYYCLETRKFYTTDSQIPMENLYYTVEPSCCCWL